MAVERDVAAFVGEALRAGASRASIAAALTTAGWPAAQIQDALDAYAPIDFAVPVPRPRPYLSPFETFAYLVLFTALYFSAMALGQVLFRFIDLAIPDPTTRILGVKMQLEGLRWSLSSLIIAFPVFVGISIYAHRATRAGTLRRDSRARKWLTYFTLYVTVLVLLSDLTYLLFNFLQGALTARFLLRVLVVGVIAGTIFVYYLGDARRERAESAAQIPR
ncbi:MAG: hypothetical protein KGK10_10240 [Rhodospirillales bacterium]|nr:hypothetical protein [Rhodospirillales bacterium]